MNRLIVEAIMNLSMAPELLVSILNTKLRNDYTSLYDLCEDLDVHLDDLEAILKNHGYHYDENQNQIKK